MKAAYTEHYLERPEDLQIVERPRPEPGAGEVLVRVRAVALNDFDWGILSGEPWFIRFFLGWRKPKIRIPGCDIAGEVVASGAGATRWQQGDRVYGDLSGGRFAGFAEYVCCGEDQLAAMPDDMRRGGRARRRSWPGRGSRRAGGCGMGSRFCLMAPVAAWALSACSWPGNAMSL